jgi:dTDP-4-amino-4,6-dideoxygalactose transaminase
MIQLVNDLKFYKMNTQIPVAKPKLSTIKEVKPWLEMIDRNRIYSNNGPISKIYIDELSKYFNVNPERIVLLTNATLALQGAISVLKPDDWLVPDYTFAATAHAVIQSGKKLHTVDVNESSWEIDYILISKLSKNKKFGILPVAPFGSKINFAPLEKFSNVVIDAAASIGAPLEDFSKLQKNWCVVYSLHATKIFPCGEGAVVICGSPQFAQKLMQWANFGFGDREIRIAQVPGVNAKMSEISAAYGLTSILNRNNEINEWRHALTEVAKNQNAQLFNSHINSNVSVKPYWIAKFQSKKIRNRVIMALNSQGIQSRVWWSAPLSSMPAFWHSSKTKNSVSKYLSETTLGLPMYRDLKDSEISLIARTIYSIIN